MSATVFYFSGTGNTYAIAESIAVGLSGRLVPITSLVGNDEVETETDSIGIIFPVYYTDVPNIVRDFIPRLKGIANKYIFTVCSFGGGVGRSIKTVKDLLRKNGGELSASYGIHMPQNAFHKPWEKKEKLYAKMEAAAERICSKTGKRAKTPPYMRVLDMLLIPFVPLMKQMSRSYMLKATGGSEDDSDLSLIYRLDCVFSVSEDCTGCGICAKVCPVQNIDMESGKPEWSHRCENCIACVNFCPQKAICGISQKDFYHLHPGYTLKLAQVQTNVGKQLAAF